MKHPWSPHLYAKGARARGRSEQLIEAVNAAARKIKAADPELPVILTRSHLAHLAGVPPQDVWRYVSSLSSELAYRTFRLKKQPKVHGSAPGRGFRTISVPEPNLMRLQRWIAQHVLAKIHPDPSSYAFFSGDNQGIVAAAKKHVNSTWLVKMDICDFFDNVGERRVYAIFRSMGYSALVSFELARICTRSSAPTFLANSGLPYKRRNVEGSLPQGAPTSPGLANIAMRLLDARLRVLAAEAGWRYTRYADDLAFSTDGAATRKIARQLVAIVKKELEDFGFKANEAKTVIVPPGARHIVLGLLVDSPAPRLTKNFKNNLDTHLHALTSKKLGPEAHRLARGFTSIIGMRRHIQGLLAFAIYVDEGYGAKCRLKFNEIDWPF